MANQFDDFLETAFKDGRADCKIQMNQILALRDALLFGLHEKCSGLTVPDISLSIQRGLTIRCEKCGQFSEQAINRIILGVGAVAFCPGCGGKIVTASFDTAKINKE